MTGKKALERWETKISNTEVTPQAFSSIAKSLLKRDGGRAPTAIHGSSGLKFHSSEKVNSIADSLEISSHTMICVMKTINGGWTLVLKLCSKP
jgi:hypothetical protein